VTVEITTARHVLPQLVAFLRRRQVERRPPRPAPA